MDAAIAAHSLSERPEFRVLRKVAIEIGRTGAVGSGERWIGVAVDLKAAGPEAGPAKPIELGMRRIRFDDRGVIIEIGAPFRWLEKPGEAVSEAAPQLAEPTDAATAVQQIDDGMAIDLLATADVILAHGAGNARPLLEQRLPAAAGRAWACSAHEVDWAGRGFEGADLGYLLNQFGYFHDAGDVVGRVDAMLQLLHAGLMTGDSVLAEMMRTASSDGLIAEAPGVEYGHQGELHARGYRWNAHNKVWRREIGSDDRERERKWLVERIYHVARDRSAKPQFVPVTWNERYA